MVYEGYERNIDVHIRHLRVKIEPDPADTPPDPESEPWPPPIRLPLTLVDSRRQVVFGDRRYSPGEPIAEDIVPGTFEQGAPPDDGLYRP